MHRFVPTTMSCGRRASQIMLFRPFAALAPTLLFMALLCGCGKSGETQMHEVRMALRASDTDPALAKRWTVFKAQMEHATGLPVKVYQSSDYNGSIQAIASNQVDVAGPARGGPPPTRPPTR